ncbi:hypothetical protein QZH41_013721, partial [Actinostola sp. cb2023]
YNISTDDYDPWNTNASYNQTDPTVITMAGLQRDGQTGDACEGVAVLELIENNMVETMDP